MAFYFLRTSGLDCALVNGNIGSPLGTVEGQRFCVLNETGKKLMRAAVPQMNPSVLADHCVLKLAGRPLGALADLAREKMILH